MTNPAMYSKGSSVGITGSANSLAANIAKGAIVIEYGKLTEAANEINNLANKIKTEFDKLNPPIQRFQESLDKAFRGTKSSNFDSSITSVQRFQQSLDKTFKTAKSSPINKMSNELQNYSKRMEEAYLRNQSLNKEQKNFLDISTLLSAAVVPTALKISNNFARLEFIMKRLVGSEKEAQEEMARLKFFAESVNQPYEEILHSATTLLPLLKGTNVELNDAVSLTIRLSELDPMQGISGASIAVREFLSGEYLSLVRRFELDREKLREITKQSKGSPTEKIRLLNEYMTSIGYGPDMLAEMEQAGIGTFDSMLDSLKQLIDKGFRPLRDDYILPTLRGIRDIARMLDDIDPAIIQGVVGAGAIASLIPLLKSIPMLAPIAPAVAPVASAFVASEATIAGTRALANTGLELGGLSRFKNATQDEARQMIQNDFKVAVKLLVIGLIELAKQWQIFIFKFTNVVANFLLNFTSLDNIIASKIKEILDSFSYLVAEFAKTFLTGMRLVFDGLKAIKLEILGQKIEPFKDISNDAIESIDNIIENLDTAGKEEQALASKEATEELWDNFLTGLKLSIDLTDEQKQILGETYTTIQRHVAGLWGLSEKIGDSLAIAIKKADELGLAANAQTGFSPTEEQLEAFKTYTKSVEDLEESSQEKRLDAEEDYLSELEDMETDFQEEIKQKQEDYNLDQKREHEDYLRKRNELIAEADDKTEKSTLDYHKKIREIEDEAREDNVDATEEYWAALKRLTDKYRLDLSEAANNLDVSKVISLQRQFSLDRGDLTSSYNEELAQIEQTRKSRIEEEKLTLTTILEENRKSREQKLKELDEEEKIRQQRAIEDYQREYDRMVEEHNKEMALREEQHKEALTEITDTLEEQKQAAIDKFIETFDKLAEEAGQSEAALLGIAEDGSDAVEKEFWTFWNNLKRTVTNGTIPVRQGLNSIGIGNVSANSAVSSALTMNRPTYQTGGMVNRSGLANLERGEHVLRPDAASAFRSIIGSEITPSNIASNFGNKNIQISFQNQNNFGDTGKYSVAQLENMFNEISRRNIENFFSGAVGKI